MRIVDNRTAIALRIFLTVQEDEEESKLILLLLSALFFGRVAPLSERDYDKVRNGGT